MHVAQVDTESALAPALLAVADELVGVDYYRPTPYGNEREIGGRLQKLRAIVRRPKGR